jgi:signal transduction histidine kinase
MDSPDAVDPGFARLVDEQGALRRIAMLVARGVDRAGVFKAVAEEVGRLLDADASNVIRFDDGLGTIVGGWTKQRFPEAPVGYHPALANAEAREQLTASRKRLVEAAQVERRRLERNLHDGAQQRLVALSVTLRLAERQLQRDPEAARESLARAGAELADALAELRELARGLHPAVLTDHGLEAALSGLAARAPLPVAVTVELDRRPPEPVEAAAYFSVAEALTNVARYASAGSATVVVRREVAGLLVEVTDDGKGGADPATGTGLRGLTDRVEALGGRLEIESPRGRGTTLRAWIPEG